MQIPWYYTTLLCLIVLITGLYFGSNDRDFITPQTEEQRSKKVAAWKSTKPSLKNTTVPSKELIVGKPKAAPILEPVAPAELVLPKFDPSTIKIKTSLMLDQFKNSELIAADRLNHASHLVSLRNYQAAHLALERVIDTAKDATADQITTAAKAIQDLPQSRSLWRPDPSNRKALAINIVIDPKLVSKVEEIKSAVEELLLQSSGGLVTPKVTISKAKFRPELPTLSTLSIKFSNGKSAPTIRFSSSTDAESLIYKAIYNSLRNAMLTDPEINTPAPLSETQISGKEALLIYITRYTWFRLIESL